MLYHICYAMIEPSVKVHIYETLCSMTNISTDCSSMAKGDEASMMLEEAVQKNAANSLVYMKLMRSVPALLIIMFCGAWSDHIGRKVSVFAQKQNSMLCGHWSLVIWYVHISLESGCTNSTNNSPLH